MNPILRSMKNRAERDFAGAQRPEKQASAPSEDLDIAALGFPAGDGYALYADLYRQKDRDGAPMPVAVMVHGGGLFTGSRSANRAFCEVLARRGFLVFAPDYRLLDAADGFREIADVSAALAFLGQNLDRFGGDAQRVFLFGESAGAWLSLYAAAAMGNASLRRLFGCAQPEYALRGLVGISGMYYTARPDPLGLVYRRDLYGRRRGNRAVMALMDPEHAAVTAALPPMLLTSSGADFLKAYTLRYADALRAQGRPSELVYFPEGKNLVHAFPSLHPDLPESKAALKRILAWMDTLG